MIVFSITSSTTILLCCVFDAVSGFFLLVLHISVPPRISPFYFEDGVTEGMRTQIMCTASQGDRPFNITWRKDSQPLGHENDSDAPWINVSDYAPFSSILTINTVTSSHSGNYTCVVTNKAGVAEYTAQLSVTGNVLYCTVNCTGSTVIVSVRCNVAVTVTLHVVLKDLHVSNILLSTVVLCSNSVQTYTELQLFSSH